MSVEGHSKACCSLPVAESEGYKLKGTYETHAGKKCYVTGPSSAKKGLLFIYDVFGFREQTQQGADILANGLDALVVMPDLFDVPAEPAWVANPADTKGEGMKKFGSWMQEHVADPVGAAKDIVDVAQQLKAEYPEVESWGGIGFCWGGKLVALTSGANSPWKAGIQSSPARVEPADAEKVTIPQMMLASKDEPADAVASFDKALKTPKVVETFTTQIHGWMSARANLNDAEVKREYERGYSMAIDFFRTHL